MTPEIHAAFAEAAEEMGKFKLAAKCWRDARYEAISRKDDRMFEYNRRMVLADMEYTRRMMELNRPFAGKKIKLPENAR